MKSVSVVIPTFNSLRTIETCLISIRNQDYQGKVEIIVADGGSTDGTKAILEKYNCKIVEERSASPETAKATGLKQARGELVLLMASDNILPQKNWLKIMVNSLIKEPRAIAAYPWRYAYRKEDSSLNRYFALMGANDPVAWFMGKADRRGWGEAKDKIKFGLVKFTPENMPTLGDNGVLAWREKLLKAQVDEQHFSHIDVFWDLVNLGLDQFVVVKNEIIHDTGEEFWLFMKKRFRYMKSLYLGQLKMRRYKWVRGYGDVVKLGGYCVYSLTLVGPVITAIRGWLKKPDWAWFWQIVMAPAMVIVYGLALIL
ncbi:MAG: glycosyltransferase family 2 protein [Patescibacteria group bacterium]